MVKAREGEALLTAADLAELLNVARSTAYELMGRIPFHVRIGLGKRQQLRLPRWAYDRWEKAGGDKWQSSESSREAPIGTPKAATATASAGAAAPSRLRAMPPPESDGESSWKEQFPGYNPSRSRKRSLRSSRTRGERK
jgi:hypothetical protein